MSSPSFHSSLCLSFSLMRMAQPFTQLSPPSVLDLILCSTSTITSVLLLVTSNQVWGRLVLNQTVMQHQLPRLKPQVLKLGETRMPAVHAEVTGVRVTTLASLPAADWKEVKVWVVCSMREGTPPLTVAIFSLCCCSHAAWSWCRMTCTKFTCTASRRSLRTHSPIKWPTWILFRKWRKGMCWREGQECHWQFAMCPRCWKQSWFLEDDSVSV